MAEKADPQVISGIDWDHIPACEAFELMKTADPEEVRQVLGRWAEQWRVLVEGFNASILTMGPDAFKLVSSIPIVPT